MTAPAYDDPADLCSIWDPYQAMQRVLEYAPYPPVRLGSTVIPKSVAVESCLIRNNRNFGLNDFVSVPVSLGDPDDPAQNPFLLSPQTAPGTTDLVDDFCRWIHGFSLPSHLCPCGPGDHACTVPACYMYAVADFLLFPKMARRALAYLKSSFACRDRPECCWALLAFDSWYPGIVPTKDLSPRRLPLRPLSVPPKTYAEALVTPQFTESLRGLLSQNPTPELLLFLCDLHGIAPFDTAVDLLDSRNRKWDHKPLLGHYESLRMWIHAPDYAFTTANHWVPRRTFWTRVRRVLPPCLWDSARNRADLPDSCCLSGSVLALCIQTMPPGWSFLDLATRSGFSNADVALFFFGSSGRRDLSEVVARLASTTSEAVIVNTLLPIGHGDTILQFSMVTGIPSDGAGARNYSLCCVTTLRELEGMPHEFPKPCEVFSVHVNSLVNAYLEFGTGRLMAYPPFLYSLIYRVSLPSPRFGGQEYVEVASRFFGIPRSYVRQGAATEMPADVWPAVDARFRTLGGSRARLRADHPIYRV